MSTEIRNMEEKDKGIGGRFLAYVKENYPETLLRLEVEKENEGAVQLYQRSGFHVLPYMEMKQ